MSPTCDASPDLPDSVLVELLRLPAIMRNALMDAGFKTVGEVRAATSEDCS
jgi:hypothetical protein